MCFKAMKCIYRQFFGEYLKGFVITLMHSVIQWNKLGNSEK